MNLYKHTSNVLLPIFFRLTIPNLRDISVLMDETNKSLNKKLKLETEEGRLEIGELIVLQSYGKVTISNGQVSIEKVETERRKLPLENIRKKLLKVQKIYMRLRGNSKYELLQRGHVVDSLKNINEFTGKYTVLSTEVLVQKLTQIERKRHIMVWHDCSTISSHSYFMIMLSIMYDPVLYLTNNEYLQKYKCRDDVQATVEQPQLYILGRCPSNEQQLLYREERINDIINSKKKLEIEGIYIEDIILVFKGDKPAAQLEIDHQKGGNYFCFNCKIN